MLTFLTSTVCQSILCISYITVQVITGWWYVVYKYEFVEALHGFIPGIQVLQLIAN